MSVYKKARSPYYHFDFVWKGRRFHGSTGCKSRREALAFEARLRQEVVLPTQSRDPITLDQAAGLYAEHAEQLPSWKDAERVIKALLKGLGAGKLLSEVSQRDLQAYLAKRRNGRANASVNRELDLVRAIWLKAHKARFEVGEMPDWKVLRLKVPRLDPRELGQDEEARLMPALRADGTGAACDYALKSGWRQAEVIGLRWSDCDFAARQAKTRIKGGDVVKRPLTPTLIAIIANQPKVGPFVFTYVCRKNHCARRRADGSRTVRRVGERYPLTVTVLRQAMKAAKKAAGVEGFRFHDFRHTRGTRIVRATGSLAAAQAALAHRSIATTLRYAHVLDEDVRNALDASDTPAVESRTIPEPEAGEGANA